MRGMVAQGCIILDQGTLISAVLRMGTISYSLGRDDVGRKDGEV